MPAYNSYEEYSKGWDDRNSLTLFVRDYKNNWSVGLKAGDKIMTFYDWVSVIPMLAKKAGSDLIFWGLEQQTGTFGLEESLENSLSEIDQQVAEIDKYVSDSDPTPEFVCPG